MESAYHDVLLHCSVRWLSCGKILLRFVKFLVEIRIFLIVQGKPSPELEDEKWLVKLMFLADITTHLNELNLRLQGAENRVMRFFLRYGKDLHLNWMSTHGKSEPPLFATLNIRRLSQ